MARSGSDEGDAASRLIDGKVRDAIDLHEGDALDGEAFKALIRAAAALNRSSR